jgi:hypothetical protein
MKRKRPVFTLEDRALLKTLRDSRESSLAKEVDVILDQLVEKGLIIWWAPMPVDGMRSERGRASHKLKGFPDRFGVTSGLRFFAFELKRPNGKGRVRDEQDLWAALLKRSGIFAFVTSVEALKRSLDPELEKRRLEWPGSDTG